MIREKKVVPHGINVIELNFISLFYKVIFNSIFYYYANYLSGFYLAYCIFNDTNK